MKKTVALKPGHDSFYLINANATQFTGRRSNGYFALHFPATGENDIGGDICKKRRFPWGTAAETIVAAIDSERDAYGTEKVKLVGAAGRRIPGIAGQLRTLGFQVRDTAYRGGQKQDW